MKQRSLVNTGDISLEMAQVNTNYRRKEQRKRWVLRKREVERSDTGEFNVGEGVTCRAT